MKCSGSSYPFSSACIIICNTSKKSLKVLEKIKTRGWHAWAGEGWKCGSAGGEPFHQLMRSGAKIWQTGLYHIICHSCYAAIKTWWERGKRQKNFHGWRTKTLLKWSQVFEYTIYVSYFKEIMTLGIWRIQRKSQTKTTILSLLEWSPGI